MSVSKLDMRYDESNHCEFMGNDTVRCINGYLKCIYLKDKYQYVCVCHGKQSAQTQIVNARGE